MNSMNASVIISTEPLLSPNSLGLSYLGITRAAGAGVIDRKSLLRDYIKERDMETRLALCRLLDGIDGYYLPGGINLRDHSVVDTFLVTPGFCASDVNLIPNITIGSEAYRNLRMAGVMIEEADRSVYVYVIIRFVSGNKYRNTIVIREPRQGDAL